MGPKFKLQVDTKFIYSMFLYIDISGFSERPKNLERSVFYLVQNTLALALSKDTAVFFTTSFIHARTIKKMFRR